MDRSPQEHSMDTFCIHQLFQSAPDNLKTGQNAIHVYRFGTSGTFASFVTT
jgi:hypothetical protein